MSRYCPVSRRAALSTQLFLLGAAVAGCTSASQQITAPGALGKCALAAEVSLTEFSADGGDGIVTVTTERDCTWEAESSAKWLTITSRGEAQGSGTVTFTVAATGDPLSRTGSLTVGERQFSITQRAAPCRFRLSALELSVPASGGGGEVDVAASSGLCEWIAQANANWVAIPTGRSYKGDARVAVQAAAWSGAVRRAELAIADQRVVVTQSTGCAYTITPAGVSSPGAGGGVSVSVAAGDGCEWAAVSNATWARIARGASGAGPGAVEINVDANTGPARSATMTIANLAFTISQASGCQYRLDPAGAGFSIAGGPAAVAMITGPGCPWTAESDAGWIAITSGHTGTGPGSLSFHVAQNIGPERTAGVRAGGQRFVATQASACTYSISPTRVAFPAHGAPGWITVTTAPDCPWTASSQADWMILNTPGGVGPGLVSFTVVPNPGGERAGTLTVAGQIFGSLQVGY